MDHVAPLDPDEEANAHPQTFLGHVFDDSMAELRKGNSLTMSTSTRADHHSSSNDIFKKGSINTTGTVVDSTVPTAGDQDQLRVGDFTADNEKYETKDNLASSNPALSNLTSKMLKPDLSFLPTNSLSTNKSIVNSNWEGEFSLYT